MNYKFNDYDAYDNDNYIIYWYFSSLEISVLGASFRCW